MAPVESFTLFQSLQDNINSSSKNTTKKNKIYCFVIQNKVSGIRQILFNDQSILFTRLISYNIDDKEFIDKYEKDIYSTFEYLKRIIPDITIKEMEIVNILPPNTLKEISAMKNVDFHFINYTPHQAATIAFNNEAIPKNSNFCDLLISKSFANSTKKILKFTTPKINILEKLFLGTKISYYTNLFLLLTIGIFCLFVINKINELEELKSIAETEKLMMMQTLNKTTGEVLDGANIKNKEEGTLELDRILDIGRIHEILGENEINLIDTYSQFKFIKKYNVQASNFSYRLLDFNTKLPQKNSKYIISLKGKIINGNGDLEGLFTQFDGITSEFSRTFSLYKVTHSELPKNIDFAKKYYDFPIELSVENIKK